MHITARDTVFTFVGSFSGLTVAEATSALCAHGATVVGHPSEQVDCIVVGERAGAALVTARALGLVEVNEAALRVLMARGEVTLAVQEVAAIPLPTMIGELRGVFDGPITARTWSRLTELLDQCSDEELPAAVRYARDHLRGWSAQGDWWGGIVRAGFLWDWGVPGARRLSPLDWTTGMLAGDRSEKFSLIEAIDLSDVQTTGTRAAGLLDHPDLRDLRMLSLGYNQLGMRFYKKLMASERLASLEYLGLRLLGATCLRGLSGSCALSSLRAVGLHTVAVEERRLAGSVEALLDACFWPQIEHLILDGGLLRWGAGEAFWSGSEGLLPALARLSIALRGSETMLLERALMHPVAAQLQRLDLHVEGYATRHVLARVAEAMSEGVLPQLRVLDLRWCAWRTDPTAVLLSGARDPYVSRQQYTFDAILLALRSDARGLDRLEQLVLPAIMCEDFVDAETRRVLEDSFGARGAVILWQ